MLIFEYFINFGQFRVSKSILPYLKNRPKDEKTIFSLSFILNFIMAVISVLFMIFISIVFGILENISSWIYPLLAVMIICEFLMIYITYALSFKERFKILSVLTAFKAIFQTLGFALIYFSDTLEKGIISYFVVVSISTFISVLIGSYLVKGYINKNFLKFRRLNLKYYFKTSFMFYLTDVVTFLTRKGVATFVAAKMTIANLAFFNMVFTHFNLLRFPNTALGAIMFPHLAKEKIDIAQRKYIWNKLKFNMLIYIPIFVLTYFLYPKLVLFFYGQEYIIVTYYFPYVLFMGIPYLIIYPVIHYFSSNGIPQYEGLINLFSLAIQIGVVIIFIRIGNLTLMNAIFSQALGFVAFTVLLILIYNYKK